MNCEKCGKKLSAFTDNRYNVVVDGKGVYVCETCYNSIKEDKECLNDHEQNITTSETSKTNEVKNKVSEYKKAKGTVAFTLKIISTIIIIATTVGGGILGFNIDYNESGFNSGGVWEHPNYAGIAGLFIGTGVGLVAGFLLTLLIRYFAELGENIKKTADATSKQASQEKSETEKIMMYKELLDNGAITQEEYEKKKAELLK